MTDNQTNHPLELPKFMPPWWQRNRHVQTILPTLLRRKQSINLHWESLELDDGDFIDMAWHPNPPENSTEPIIFIFHGLEGSAHSPYAKGMLQALANKGWNAAVVHFRGCSGKPNRLWRGYHSGDYHDADTVISHYRNHFPDAPMAAIGYSLGGNMLAQYLANHQDTPLRAACIVSAPFELAACSDRINRGFSRVYQSYLLRRMKKNLRKKASRFANPPLTEQQIDQWQTFVEFDNGYTAPTHGFNSAAHYYQRCSALPVLTRIRTPALIIHAHDDPFMDSQAIPKPQQLSAYIDYRLLKHGGHVGFISGSLRRPHYWLETTIPQWIANQLELN